MTGFDTERVLNLSFSEPDTTVKLLDTLIPPIFDICGSGVVETGESLTGEAGSG